MTARLLGPVVVGLLALALAVGDATAPAHAAGPSSRYIVMLKGSVANAARSSTTVVSKVGGERVATFAGVQAFSALFTSNQAAKVADDPAVAFVLADHVIHQPQEPRFSVDCRNLVTAGSQCLPENVKRIGAPMSSQQSGNETGSLAGPRIGIIDSGIDSSDPDLRVAGGVDCSSGTPAPLAHPIDVQGHGTEVSGVVAGLDDHQGIVGIAPGAPLISIQALDADDDATLSSLICSVDYVTSTLTDEDPTNDVRLVNASVEGDVADVGTAVADDGACGLRNHDPLHLAICRSVARGAVYSVAAGNDADDIQKFVPAGYHEVVTTTAITDLDGEPGGKGGTTCYGTEAGADDTPAAFSNFATRTADRLHTVAAVGGCVVTSYPDFPYVIDSGTSFAAPATTGVIALCLSSGRCPAKVGAVTTVRILVEAAAYNLRHRDYGYSGDPTRSRSGSRYYGFLVNAGQY